MQKRKEGGKNGVNKEWRKGGRDERKERRR